MRTKVLLLSIVFLAVLSIVITLVQSKKVVTITPQAVDRLLGVNNGDLYMVVGSKIIKQNMKSREVLVVASAATLATLSLNKESIFYITGDSSNASTGILLALSDGSKTTFKSVTNYGWYKNDPVIFTSTSGESGYDVFDSKGTKIGSNITATSILSTFDGILARTDLDPNAGDESSPEAIYNPILPNANTLARVSKPSSSIAICDNNIIYIDTSNQLAVSKVGSSVKIVDTLINDEVMTACGDAGSFYIINKSEDKNSAVISRVDDGGLGVSQVKSITLPKGVTFSSPFDNSIDGKVLVQDGKLFVCTSAGVLEYTL